jgi:hypothetical protein
MSIFDGLSICIDLDISSIDYFYDNISLASKTIYKQILELT